MRLLVDRAPSEGASAGTIEKGPAVFRLHYRPMVCGPTHNRTEESLQALWKAQ
jgi:hypothetical protein